VIIKKMNTAIIIMTIIVILKIGNYIFSMSRYIILYYFIF